MVHSTLGSGWSQFILHWLLGVTVYPTLGPGEPCSVLHCILDNHCLLYTGFWEILIHLALDPGKSWSVLFWVLESRGLFYTGSWGVIVHPTPATGGRGLSHTGSSYTGSWGFDVHPTLGAGGSWSILHRVWGSRGPTHAGS